MMYIELLFDYFHTSLYQQSIKYRRSPVYLNFWNHKAISYTTKKFPSANPIENNQSDPL